MDKKSIIIATVALLVVIVILFKDTLSERAPLDQESTGPRASLARSSSSNPNQVISEKNMSPLSKVLAAFDSSSIRGANATKSSSSHEPNVIPKVASWEMMRQEKFQQIVVTARNNALKISAELPKSAVNSKYSLISFASGVDFVLSQPTETLSAEEAISYLQVLHSRVANSLREEGIDSKLIASWSHLPFDAARVSAQPTAIATSIQQVPKENVPELALHISKVNVRKNSLYSKIYGVVRGNEIDRVEVYRNGTYLFNVLRGRVVKNNSPFFFRYHDGTGVWTIRVVAKDGGYIERSYRFLGYQGGQVNIAPFATKTFLLPGGGANWETF